MDVCAGTGLAVPECSCSACRAALILEHAEPSDAPDSISGES